MLDDVWGVITAVNATVPTPAADLYFSILAELKEGAVPLDFQRSYAPKPDPGTLIYVGGYVGAWVKGYDHPDGTIRWDIPYHAATFDCEAT